jgi:hypothetical protein
VAQGSWIAGKRIWLIQHSDHRHTNHRLVFGRCAGAVAAEAPAAVDQEALLLGPGPGRLLGGLMM